MKISIVTVYNSENCGSFWQAYALKTILEKRGNVVRFYKRSTNNTSHSFFLLLLRTIRFIAMRHFCTVKELWKQYLSFRSAQKVFRTSRMKSDAYVIGSDTLWAVENSYFKNNYHLYFGKTLAKGYVLTYAVSAGNASFAEFVNLPNIREMLSNLKGISVRDNYTAELVERIVGEKPIRVLDPTLLLKAEDYKSMAKPISTSPFILIYTFEALNKEEWEKVETIQREEHLEVLVYGRFESGKLCIGTDPRSFISYFNEATYIITDTFHGTIFSMLFHKKFVIIDRKKQKVTELATHFLMTDRIIATPSEILEKLHKAVNYTAFEKLREIEYEICINYIDTTLRKTALNAGEMD